MKTSEKMPAARIVAKIIAVMVRVGGQRVVNDPFSRMAARSARPTATRPISARIV
jgi:hypothetical protein